MKKLFIYPKHFNFEMFLRNKLFKISRYKWKKYKVFHVSRKLYYVDLFNQYILYNKYYFLDKKHKIEEYDISIFNIKDIFNILVGLFGINTQIQIRNYFMMVGNTLNAFTLYNYCVLEHNEISLIENMFPTFELENDKINLTLYEVKYENPNVQNFSSRKIKIINNKITKDNEK